MHICKYIGTSLPAKLAAAPLCVHYICYPCLWTFSLMTCLSVIFCNHLSFSCAAALWGAKSCAVRATSVILPYPALLSCLLTLLGPRTELLPGKNLRTLQKDWILLPEAERCEFHAANWIQAFHLSHHCHPASFWQNPLSTLKIGILRYGIETTRAIWSNQCSRKRRVQPLSFKSMPTCHGAPRLQNFFHTFSVSQVSHQCESREKAVVTGTRSFCQTLIACRKYRNTIPKKGQQEQESQHEQTQTTGTAPVVIHNLNIANVGKWSLGAVMSSFEPAHFCTVHIFIGGRNTCLKENKKISLCCAFSKKHGVQTLQQELGEHWRWSLCQRTWPGLRDVLVNDETCYARNNIRNLLTVPQETLHKGADHGNKIPREKMSPQQKQEHIIVISEFGNAPIKGQAWDKWKMRKGKGHKGHESMISCQRLLISHIGKRRRTITILNMVGSVSHRKPL